MERKISRHSFRRKLAQRLLGLLYGKGYYDGGLYFSHWKHASVGADAVLTRGNKVLLTRRRGVDRAGQYCLPGGHMNLEDAETFWQTMTREVREETGIVLEGPAQTPAYVSIIHNLHSSFQDDRSCVTVFFHVPLTDEHLEQLQETDEAHDFTFCTVDDIKAMHARGEMAFDHHVEGILGTLAKGTNRT